MLVELAIHVHGEVILGIFIVFCFCVNDLYCPTNNN